MAVVYLLVVLEVPMVFLRVITLIKNDLCSQIRTWASFAKQTCPSLFFFKQCTRRKCSVTRYATEFLRGPDLNIYPVFVFRLNKIMYIGVLVAK